MTMNEGMFLLVGLFAGCVVGVSLMCLLILYKDTDDS